MRFKLRFWLFLSIIGATCLMIILLASGYNIPGVTSTNPGAEVLAVPNDDLEIAWIHNNTANYSWERFVTGIARVKILDSTITIDDSNAYNDSTTATPEIVISRLDCPGKIRIRWYKLQNNVSIENWIKALASRDPAPIAIIGGTSTDQAIRFCQALESTTTWRTQPPLFFITTATADRADAEEEIDNQGQRIVNIYKDRTFRVCYTNEHMARSLVDFIWSQSEYRPICFRHLAASSLFSNLWPHTPIGKIDVFNSSTPNLVAFQWEDDPYSIDFFTQFRNAVFRHHNKNKKSNRPINMTSARIKSSIGGYYSPNTYEERTAKGIAQMTIEMPEHRYLFVLPTVAAPARRVLSTILQSSPILHDRLICATGDGITLNTLFRDGDFAWPIETLPIPLIFFAHQNPIDWDDSKVSINTNHRLQIPNSTDDALLNTELGRIIIDSSFYSPNDNEYLSDSNRLVDDSNILLRRVKERNKSFFEDNGERRGGVGEYIVVLRPIYDRFHVIIDKAADVWTRQAGNDWTLLRSIRYSQYIDSYRNSSP